MVADSVTHAASAAFDASLVPGLKCEVRWTNCYRFPRGVGTVVKVNPKTVLVSLDSSVVIGSSTWPAGQTIKVARFLCNGYSINNGVFPVV